MLPVEKIACGHFPQCPRILAPIVILYKVEQPPQYLIFWETLRTWGPGLGVKVEKGTVTEVNISSYPVTPVTDFFFFSRAEIFILGCFVQKYSDLGVSCRNICQVPFRVTQSEKCILEKVTQMVL